MYKSVLSIPVSNGEGLTELFDGRLRIGIVPKVNITWINIMWRLRGNLVVVAIVVVVVVVVAVMGIS